MKAVIDFKTFDSQPCYGGIQYKKTFDNGYGVSIIRHSFSYGHNDGLWELAVIGKDGHLCYDTPITNDVMGYLTEEDVNETVRQVSLLTDDYIDAYHESQQSAMENESPEC